MPPVLSLLRPASSLRHSTACRAWRALLPHVSWLCATSAPPHCCSVARPPPLWSGSDPAASAPIVRANGSTGECDDFAGTPACQTPSIRAPAPLDSSASGSRYRAHCGKSSCAYTTPPVVHDGGIRLAAASHPGPRAKVEKRPSSSRTTPRAMVGSRYRPTRRNGPSNSQQLVQPRVSAGGSKRR